MNGGMDEGREGTRENIWVKKVTIDKKVFWDRGEI